jgi:hypothetical protein
MGAEFLALMIPIIGVTIPVVAIWTRHKEKMAEIKARIGSGNAAANTELAQAVNDLRQEVASLRETSTRFDMAFDAAITRLEDRMDRVETRQEVVPSGATIGYSPTPSASETLTAGSGRAG